MLDNNSCKLFKDNMLLSVYSVQFCVALVCNLFALWLLVTKQRSNWHSGVVLSCNLVISDLLYGFTLPLFIDYYWRRKNWQFGAALCKIQHFLFKCNLYASIYFIMCISVNRYIAIVHPFFSRNHVSPAKAKAASVIVWIFVTAISSPVLKFATTCPTQNNSTHCQFYNCKHLNQTYVAYSLYPYKMSLTVFGCFVPFLVTFVSYWSLLRVVWRNNNITCLEKRKVALMVLAAVIMYAICFLPYHLIQSYPYYQSLNCTSEYKRKCDSLNVAFHLSKGLVTMNMCLHPLLYAAVFDSIKVTCFGRNIN